MTQRFVQSRDGTRLAYVTAGDPGRPPILLIHGWAQQFTCWRPVMEALADRFFLVAMDLRGHGASDKPAAAEAYTHSALWAADVQAVIAELALKRPVLVGWSYGSRVIAAYLASHGGGALAGVVLIGGILALGRAREDWMMGPASPGLDRDLYTDDLPRRLSATAKFVAAATAAPLPRQTYAEMVGANMLCPAHVRRALFRADLDLRPVYGAMACPGLVIHGTADAIVAPRGGEIAAEVMPRGKFLPYPGIGHVPHLEDPARVAADLRRFADARTRRAA